MSKICQITGKKAMIATMFHTQREEQKEPLI